MTKITDNSYTHHDVFSETVYFVAPTLSPLEWNQHIFAMYHPENGLFVFTKNSIIDNNKWMKFYNTNYDNDDIVDSFQQLVFYHKEKLSVDNKLKGQSQQYFNIIMNNRKLDSIIPKINMFNIDKLNSIFAPHLLFEIKQQRDSQQNDANLLNPCGICLNDDTTHVCVPCGHRFCEECIDNIHRCPLCQTGIQLKMKYY